MTTTQCSRCDTDTTGTNINLVHLDGSTESICTDCYRTIKVCRHDGDGDDVRVITPAQKELLKMHEDLCAEARKLFELDYERSPDPLRETQADLLRTVWYS